MRIGEIGTSTSRRRRDMSPVTGIYMYKRCLSLVSALSFLDFVNFWLVDMSKIKNTPVVMIPKLSPYLL